MSDLIITPSSGKIDFIYQSGQEISRLESITIDPTDGLVFSGKISASSVTAPLNIINVTAGSSNINYPFIFASSGETGAKSLLMDSAGGTYNPSTNLATVNISGTSSWATNAVTNANLTGDVTSVGNATTIANSVVTNAKLTNSSVTIGSTAISLGATPTVSIAGLTSVTSTTFVGALTGTATTASYANALNAANSYTVAGITGTLTGNVTGTATTASYANALNPANSYTVAGITGNLTGNVTGTATTASYANNLNAANKYTVVGITGSLFGTSSWATNATNTLQLGGTAAASYVTLTGAQNLSDKTITGAFTGNLTGTATTASYANALNAANSYTIAGLTVNGNFAVNGSLTVFSASNVYITSSNLVVTDNIITMNALSPYQRYAGIQMYDTGSGTLSNFLWDGDGDYFFLSGSSVNGKIITGPDSQANLSANFVPKATAGYKLGNSIIYDNGTSVGIGTTTVNQKVSIYPGTTGGISLQDIDSETRAYFFIDNTNPTYSTGIRTQNYYLDFDSSGGSQNAIRFYTGTSTIGTGIERMRIISTGNVGIGTTAPGARLEINASGSSINLLRGVTYNDSNASFNNASLEYYDTSTSNASTVTKINYNAYFNKRGTANITGYTVGNFNGSTQIDSGSVNLIWDYSSRIEIRNQATASSLVHFVADSGYVTAQGGVLGKATDRIGFFVRSQNQSALTLTNQYGIYIEDLGQSTNNYAFYSNVSAASNKYNIYAAGTANNYFAGYVGIGATSFVYGAANRGLLEVYGSSDALIALRNDTANFYIHKSGNNFAMVNGGAGYMTFNTNGSDRLYIDSNGYIGIATTSILTTGGNAQLSISTNTTAVALSFGASNNDMSYIRRLSDGVYQWQTYNSGNTGQIHLQPYGGSVGIGTTSPSSTLHVNSTTAGATLLRTDGTNGTLFSVVDDLSDSLMSVNNSAGLPVLEVFADDRIVMGQYGQNDFVLVNNKVGIGTNNPANKLTVSGSVSIGSGTYNTSAPTNGLIVEGKVGVGTNSVDSWAQLKVIGTSALGGIVYVTDKIQALSAFPGSATNLQLNTDGGNVGIGTTLPFAKLHVQGNISGSSFTSSISNAVGFLGTSSWATNATNALQLGGTAAADYVTLTGTQTLTGKTITGTFTGNLTGTATTASYANALNAANSYTVVGITGNLTGNVTGTATTASYANALNAANSYTVTGITGALTGTSSWATNATNALQLGGTAAASYVTLTGTQTLTGKTITGTFTGNLTGTSSWASNAVTALNGGVTSVSGTANQVIVSGNTGAVTFSLPQSIHTTATPTFTSVSATTFTGNLTGTATTASYANALNAANSYTVVGITGALTGTATTASYANALNTSNSYTGVNFTATGFFQTNGGSIKTDTASGLAVLTTADGAQSIRTKGILLGTSYDTNPSANEIRTTNNTSLYLNARGTGDIQFQTTDSLKMMLLNNGNVGIGTTSPTAKLVVMGDDVQNYAKSSVPTAIIAGDDVEFLIGTTDNFAGEEITLRMGSVLNTYYDKGAYVKAIQGANVDRFKLAFGTSDGATATTKMTIANDGNVGIGTTVASASLHINSTTAGATLLRTDGTNGTLFSVVDDLSDSLMSVNNSAGLPVLEVFADDRIVAGQYGQNDFVVVNNKVGIGTNNPPFKLYVTGSLGVNASSLDTNWPFVVSDNSSAGSRYGLNKAGSMGFNNADNYAQLQLVGTNGAYLDLTNSVGGDSNARLIYYAGSRLELTYGFTTTITLDSTGVGIGTTVPSGELHIYGAQPAFRIQSSVSGSMQFGQWDGTYNRIQSSARDFLLISTDATNLIFSTNTTERMRISGSGTIQLNALATYASLTYEPSIIYTRAGQSGIGGIYFGNSYNSNNNVGMQLRVSNDGTQVQAVTINNQGCVGIGLTLPTTPLHVVGVISGSSFTGAGTGLTGTAASLTAGTATNATQFGSEANTNFMRGLAGGTEANLDTYTDNGFRSIAYTGYSRNLLSFNPGGSTGTVQHEYYYNIPSSGWRVRNKTDNTTWSAWGNVVMTDTNQGALTGTIITTNSNATVSGLTAGAVTNGVYTIGNQSIAGNKTFTGTTIVTGSIETAAVRETFSAVSSTTTVSIDLSTATVFNLTFTSTISAFNITNVNTSRVNSFTLITAPNGTGATIAWSFQTNGGGAANVKWASNVSPTATTTTGRFDIFSFVYNGTNWYGFTGGQNYV